MRLIDADKLHYHRELIDKLDHGIGSAVVVYAKEIDKAPLVEAIPIEWIEEYCAENWVEYSSQHDAIRRMLEDWAKENDE